MKASKDTKAKFLGNYIGCDVEFFREDDQTWQPSVLTVSDFPFLINKKVRLLAIPLSQIKDEDAIEVAEIFYPEGKDLDQILLHKNELQQIIDGLFDDIEGYKVLNVFDYLRSKSYALPFQGITVEQQIANGWVKLK